MVITHSFRYQWYLGIGLVPHETDMTRRIVKLIEVEEKSNDNKNIDDYLGGKK